jgi:hypothetical protein
MLFDGLVVVAQHVGDVVEADAAHRRPGPPLSLAAVCDNSVGAVNRHPDPQGRDLIDRLCDGDGQGITADHLSDLMNTLDALQSSRAVKPTS